eukprot:Nk52_evm1s1723 gene=Nk52_evmTU1s1723
MELTDIFDLVWGIGRVLMWSVLPAMMVKFGLSFLQAVRKENGTEKEANPESDRKKVIVFFAVLWLAYEFASVAADVNPTYYEILQVKRHATNSEVKSSFRKMSMIYHPDKNDGDDTKFTEIRLAYESIGDLKVRRFYDRYGPEYLDCTHCKTLEDFDQYFLVINAVFYLVAVVITYLSTSATDRNFLRMPFLFALVVMAVSEYVGIHSTNGEHPFEEYLFDRPLFVNISILRKLYFTVMIVCSIAASMWYSNSYSGTTEERLERIEQKQAASMEAIKLLLAAQDKFFFCLDDPEIGPLVSRKIQARNTIMRHPEIQKLAKKLIGEEEIHAESEKKKEGGEEPAFSKEKSTNETPGAA